MTRQQLLEELKRLKKTQEDNYDPEPHHRQADALLLKYINDIEIQEAFDEIDKWYS